MGSSVEAQYSDFWSGWCQVDNLTVGGNPARMETGSDHTFRFTNNTNKKREFNFVYNHTILSRDELSGNNWDLVAQDGAHGVFLVDPGETYDHNNLVNHNGAWRSHRSLNVEKQNGKEYKFTCYTRITPPGPINDWGGQIQHGPFTIYD